MAMPVLHQPVLLYETIEALAIDPDAVYIDATFGRGGHAQHILERLSEKGRLIGLDRDPEALQYGRTQWGHDPRLVLVHACFSDVEAVMRSCKVRGPVKGILADCGVSSPQLDDPARGFSFLREGPLDMRMDPTKGISACEWLAEATVSEMIRVFREYGEETHAKRIAWAIADCRVTQPLTRTSQLADLIKSCVPFKKGRRHHPATQVFQAIRIEINQELRALALFLDASVKILAPEGRLAVISFHSLEDRIIKRFFRSQSRVTLPKGIAIPQRELVAPMEWVVKRQFPTAEEVAHNPRARSATLRVGKKRANDREPACR